MIHFIARNIAVKHPSFPIYQKELVEMYRKRKCLMKSVHSFQ